MSKQLAQQIMSQSALSVLRLPNKGLTGLIRMYRYLVSPWVGTCCRFYPSCSTYALEALQQHGMGYGLWLISKRLLSCHPWHSGGYDPVPNKKSF